jgi:hypothetical protein
MSSKEVTITGLKAILAQKRGVCLSSGAAARADRSFERLSSKGEAIARTSESRTARHRKWPMTMNYVEQSEGNVEAPRPGFLKSFGS